MLSMFGLNHAQENDILDTSNNNLTTSLLDIKKNCVIAELELLTIYANYERIIPINEKFGFTTRIGIGRDGGNKETVVGLEAKALYGGPKRFVEAGLSYPLYLWWDTDPSYIIKAGYRYQNANGFIYKITPLVIFFKQESGEESWLPMVGFSIGYAF